MRTLVFVVSLVLASWAQASCELSSVRLGSLMIMTGDSERRVVEAEPDRTVRLETREGGAAGYRHDFYERDQTIQIYVSAGQVTRICRVRD